MPKRILGTIHIIIEQRGAPLAKGEKRRLTGERAALVIAENKLTSPKVSPMTLPKRGPSIIELIITGMCIVVIETGGMAIKPRGVKPNNSSIATNRAKVVKRMLLFDTFNIFISPYCRSLSKDAA